MGKTKPPRPTSREEVTLICNTKFWDTYTYGEKYTGYISSGMFSALNDRGERTWPMLNGVNLDSEEKGTIHYFLTPDDWREKRLKELLDERNSNKTS